MDYSRTPEARERATTRRESRRRKYTVTELDFAALLREVQGVNR